MQRGLLYSSLFFAVWLTGCNTFAGKKSAVIADQVADPNMRVSGQAAERSAPDVVKCVNEAIGVLKEAAKEGVPRYAPKEYSFATKAIEKAIGIVDKNPQLACELTKLAIAECKHGIYNSIAIQDATSHSYGYNKQLETASVIKPNSANLYRSPPTKRKVQAVRKKVVKELHAHSGDPLVAFSQHSAENDAQTTPAHNKRSTSNNGDVKKPRNIASKEPVFVNNATFYNAFSERGNAFATKGRDATGDYLKYTVLHGDALWLISKNLFHDAQLWPFIFRSNKRIISNPDLIYPGQKLTFRPRSELTYNDELRLRGEAVSWDKKRNNL